MDFKTKDIWEGGCMMPQQLVRFRCSRHQCMASAVHCSCSDAERTEICPAQRLLQSASLKKLITNRMRKGNAYSKTCALCLGDPLTRLTIRSDAPLAHLLFHFSSATLQKQTSFNILRSNRFRMAPFKAAQSEGTSADEDKYLEGDLCWASCCNRVGKSLVNCSALKRYRWHRFFASTNCWAQQN